MRKTCFHAPLGSTYYYIFSKRHGDVNMVVTEISVRMEENMKLTCST
jgi:hypothetical protein